MRIARFRTSAGSVRTGEWTDNGIKFGKQVYDPEEVSILPPTQPSKIVCVAGNYVEHIRESGYDLEDLPDRPGLFLKGPNTVAGHEDSIPLPTPGAKPEEIEDSGAIKRGERRIDYEAEFGVIIGEQCKDVTESEAMNVVRGFTCLNDVSNRDDQGAETNWVRGKAFDNSAPMGPVLATPDEVPENPRVQLRLNGETKQDSSDDELVFSVKEVIAETTKFLTLEPGDVIAMGTTRGVGPLSSGDTIEIEVEGIGTLVHYIDE